MSVLPSNERLSMCEMLPQLRVVIVACKGAPTAGF